MEALRYLFWFLLIISWIWYFKDRGSVIYIWSSRLALGLISFLLLQAILA